MRIVACIQCRYNSSRLPGKALMQINGKPMLQIIYDEAKKSLVSQVVVGTTSNSAPIVQYALENGMPLLVYGDGEDNVLGRITACAEAYNADYVVRIWGDCPMIEHEHIDYCIGNCFKGDYDYFFDYYEKGKGVAVISWDLLARLSRELQDDWSKENFHTVIINNPDEYNAKVIGTPYNDSSINYSVDTIEDLKRVEECMKSGN